MSHLSNETAAQLVAAAQSDVSVATTAVVSSVTQDAATRVVPVQAGTKDFGRVRIGGCCIRY